MLRPGLCLIKSPVLHRFEDAKAPDPRSYAPGGIRPNTPSLSYIRVDLSTEIPRSVLSSSQARESAGRDHGAGTSMTTLLIHPRRSGLNLTSIHLTVLNCILLMIAVLSNVLLAHDSVDHLASLLTWLRWHSLIRSLTSMHRCKYYNIVFHEQINEKRVESKR